MASSENNNNNNSAAGPVIEAQIRFRVLDAIYRISEGDMNQPVSTQAILQHLGFVNDDNNMQNLIQAALGFLQMNGLAGTLGSSRITLRGIDVYEDAILNPANHGDIFPVETIEEVSTDQRREEIENILRQRDAILNSAVELQRNNPRQPISVFEIGRDLNIDDRTCQRIFFYLIAQRRIRSFASGSGRFFVN